MGAAAARDMAQLTGRIWISLALCTFVLRGAPDSEFVGSKACFGCHANIYTSFLKTGMGRSMRLADDLAAGALPGDATVEAGKRTLRAYRSDSAWHQSESEPNVFTEAHKLEYVVGSGMNGLSFIVRRGDYLFQAPLSFYSKPGKWDLSPGYQLGDLGFSRAIPQQCALCHSGRPQGIQGRNGKYLDPPFRELAIGCENCHGPGAAHIRNPKRGASIVNPAKLPARLAEQICMNCHQGGDARVLQPGKTYDEFRPGQWLSDTVAIFKIPAAMRGNRETDLLEHNSAMRSSRCFRASQGKLSCLTCHDPHVQPEAAAAPAYFRSKCLTCHTSQSCRSPMAARRATTPADNCIGCHMPKRNVTTISHSALTNHRIPARPDDASPPADVPDEKTDLVLVDAPPGRKAAIPDITLLKAYAEVAPSNPMYQQRYLSLLQSLASAKPDEPYLQAALGHKALAEGRYEDAVGHLTAGLKLGEATVYQDLAQALTKLGRSEEALTYLQSAVELEPFNAVILKTLVLDYITLHRYEQAKQQMQRYVELFPEDSFMRDLLARVSR